MIRNGKKLCDSCENKADTLYRNPMLKYTNMSMCLDCVLAVTKHMICEKCYSVTNEFYNDGSGKIVCKDCLIKNLKEYDGENKDEPGETEADYYDRLDHYKREQSLCDAEEFRGNDQ